MPEQDSYTSDYVQYLQKLFRDYYSEASPHLLRKEYIQRLFDGDISEDEWPTMSEVYIPLLRKAIKTIMPDIMEYVFPMNGFVSLIPRDQPLPYDVVRSFEKSLDNMLQYKMKVRRKSLPIIQDGLKFGAGYGVVEKSMITTEQSKVFSIQQGGKIMMKNRQMGVSTAPTVVPSLRYIPYECIIPSGDGCTPEDSSLVIHVDYLREDQFDALYRSQEASEKKIYRGDPNKIKQETVDKGIGEGMYPHFWNMMVLGGETTPSMQNRFQKIHAKAMTYKAGNKGKIRGPLMIPIVKYYFKREHVWLVNGDTMIYHDRDTYETLRNPILKASPDLDSNNWWALSDAAAARDIPMAVNMYQNALMDLLTQYLRPTIVYDTTRYGGSEPPRHEPWGTIPIAGKIQDAYSVVTPPPTTQGMFQIGDSMSNQYNEIMGVPLGGQQSPGMVRGGSHALEGLLQTTSGRSELTGMVMDMGFIDPLILNTIVQMQTLPQETYEYIEMADRDYVQNRVTLDDIKYAFDVNIDMREKMRHSLSEKMAEMQMYAQVYNGNPRIRQDIALERVIGNKETARELIANEDEYKANMEEMQKQIQPDKASTQAAQGEAGRQSQGRM